MDHSRSSRGGSLVGGHPHRQPTRRVSVRSQKTRDESIVDWLPLVRLIAVSEFKRLGGLTKLLVIEVDDLVQSGILGLMAAIDHFDPALSASKTYFSRRIRWAMLDFLRSFPYFKNGEAVGRENADVLDSQPSNCDELRRVETRVDVEKLTGLLSANQRRVILAMMYDVAQHSIAARLEITEGRVSQIKSESLAILRSHLDRQPSPTNPRAADHYRIAPGNQDCASARAA